VGPGGQGKEEEAARARFMISHPPPPCVSRL
jgi:hypothetical protein